MVDPEGRFTEVNESLANMLGYSPDELKRFTALDITHPEDVEASREKLEALIRGDIEAYRMEKRFIKKDGKELWTGLSTSAVRDSNGKPMATIGVISDISERKLAEEALRKSEERLEMAVQGADLGLWDLDVKSGKAVVNERAAQMTGYESHELDPTMSLLERLCHPGGQGEGVKCPECPYEPESPALDEEYRILTKSGAWKWIQARGKVAERDEHGNALRMAGTFLDITQRKKSDLARLRLSTAVGQAEEAIMITDLAGTIQYVNPAFEKMTGYSKDEALGKNPRILKSGKQDQKFHRNLLEHRNTRQGLERTLCQHTEGWDLLPRRRYHFTGPRSLRRHCKFCSCQTRCNAGVVHSEAASPGPKDGGHRNSCRRDCP